MRSPYIPFFFNDKEHKCVQWRVRLTVRGKLYQFKSGAVSRVYTQKKYIFYPLLYLLLFFIPITQVTLFIDLFFELKQNNPSICVFMKRQQKLLNFPLRIIVHAYILTSPNTSMSTMIYFRCTVPLGTIYILKSDGIRI